MKLDKKVHEWFIEELAEGIAYGDSKTSKNMKIILEAYLESINKPVETTNEQPKEQYIGDEYWMIITNKEGLCETKFLKENDAINKAKSIENKNWESSTQFFHCTWINPTDGYYDEDSYTY